MECIVCGKDSQSGTRDGWGYVHQACRGQWALFNRINELSAALAGKDTEIEKLREKWDRAEGDLAHLRSTTNTVRAMLAERGEEKG